MWAQAKKEDIIKGNLRKFDKFKVQLEQWFADPICPQQALHKIHSFMQGRMSAQAFLDKFKILKGIGRLREERVTLPVMLRTHSMNHEFDLWIQCHTSWQLYQLCYKVQKIALNLDINYGYQHASGSTGTNNKSPPILVSTNWIRSYLQWLRTCHVDWCHRPMLL